MAKKPQKRREDLIEVAVRVFAERGYQGASTQEIGELFGVLKGSLYYYVSSKEELLFAVMESVHDDVKRNLQRARERQGSVPERLRAFMEDFLDTTLRRLDYAAVFYREFRHLSEEHKSVIIGARDEYERFLQELLTEGQSDGVVRKDIDARLLAVSSLTTVSSLYTWFDPEGRFSIDEVKRAYTEICLASLAPVEP